MFLTTKYKRLLVYALVGCSTLVVSLRIVTTKPVPQYTLTVINTFAEAQKEFDNATKRTLFVFDIDETLITTKDLTFQLRNLLFDTRELLNQYAQKSDETVKKLAEDFPKHDALVKLAKLFPANTRLKTLLTLYPDVQSGKELEEIFNEYILFNEILTKDENLNERVLRDQSYVLLDPAIPTIIKKLKEKNVPVIALSAFSAYTYKQKKSNQQKRYDDLGNLGIIFSTEKELPSFNSNWFNFWDKPVSLLHFSDLPPVRPKYKTSSSILFYKGIISTFNVPKGLILSYFIQCLNTKPLTVIFFDNIFENLVSVAEELKILDIPVHSYLYTAEQKLPKEKVELAVLQKQFEYMREAHTYVSYEQTRKVLEQFEDPHQSVPIIQRPPPLPGAVETEE